MSEIAKDPIFRAQYEHGAQESDDVSRLLSGIEPGSPDSVQTQPAPRQAQPVRSAPETFGPMVRLR
jgi:hypothetical protein